MQESPTFADLLAPITPDDFFAAYHGRQWVHIEGARDKFGDPLPWERFNELLGMTSKWSSETLRLYVDGRTIAAPDYCEQTGGRSDSGELRPVPPKVMALLRQGAALVANEVDSATPGVSGISNALEAELGTNVNCNLYCTWREHQGFKAHFDVHDVYAIQIHGEKRWNIYENRVEGPVPHARFYRGGRTSSEAGAGALAAQVVTRPGDLLYLPRGQYHDAISVSGASLHLTFGALAFTGLDFLNTVLVQAVQDPLLRRNFPRAEDGRPALKEHLAALAKRVSATARDPDFVARFAAYQQSLRTIRGGYSLPIDIDAPAYRLAGGGFRVEEHAGDWYLAGPKGRVAIPAEVQAPVRWIIETGTFTEQDLAETHPDVDGDGRTTLLKELAGMRVIERV